MHQREMLVAGAINSDRAAGLIWRSPVLANGTPGLAQSLSYSSWRCHQTPVSLRPLGARSSQWYTPKSPLNGPHSAPAGSQVVGIPRLQSRPLGEWTSIGTGNLLSFNP